MLGELALLSSHRTLRRLDILAVLLVVVFLALGTVTGLTLGRLAEVGTSLREAAQALDLTARGISLLDQVPVVGDPAGRLADSVAETATSLRAGAGNVARTVAVLAILLGSTIAVLPLPILLGLYLPLRLARRREVHGLRRLLAGSPDPMLTEHLARAALSRVPYAQLRRVSATPWRDVDSGRHRALAAAELRRLGVPVPHGWTNETPSGAARSQTGSEPR